MNKPMLPYTNNPTHDDFLNRLDVYQSQYNCSNLSILNVLDMTPELLEGIIQRTKNVNARLFSLLDLLTNKHPNYELHKRDTSTPQITQPLCVGVPEKAVDIQTVLRKLTGTTIFNSYALESASNIIGLSQNVLMGYLKMHRTPRPSTWVIMLLLADMHPYYFVTERNS